MPILGFETGGSASGMGPQRTRIISDSVPFCLVKLMSGQYNAAIRGHGLRPVMTYC
jgi:hypothetical protein